MTINLSEVNFDNDFFELTIPNGYTLRINSVDESIKVTDDYSEDIDSLNIEVIDEELKAHLCSSVIGMSNDYFAITTDYKEYEGDILTRKNMQYCTIEVFE